MLHNVEIYFKNLNAHKNEGEAVSYVCRTVSSDSGAMRRYGSCGGYLLAMDVTDDVGVTVVGGVTVVEGVTVIAGVAVIGEVTVVGGVTVLSVTVVGGVTGIVGAMGVKGGTVQRMAYGVALFVGDCWNNEHAP